MFHSALIDFNQLKKIIGHFFTLTKTKSRQISKTILRLNIKPNNG